LLCLGLFFGLAPGAWAVETRFPERNDTRQLAVKSQEGQPIGEGTLTQWTEGDRLHVLLIYRYADGRTIEESAVFLQEPELVQEKWTWRERKDQLVTRRYNIDFTTGRALGVNRTRGSPRRYSEQMQVEPGRTFAGVGFILAAKNLLPVLRQGKDVELRALAFTPAPREVKVRLSQQGSERIQQGGQTLAADKVVVHPEIGIASLVVKVPDTLLYFSGAEPPMLVAGVGPLLEPGDPVVRTEVLPRGRAPAAARPGPEGPR
jgi:hypothetical protein